MNKVINVCNNKLIAGRMGGKLQAYSFMVVKYVTIFVLLLGILTACAQDMESDSLEELEVIKSQTVPTPTVQVPARSGANPEFESSGNTPASGGDDNANAPLDQVITPVFVNLGEITPQPAADGGNIEAPGPGSPRPEARLAGLTSADLSDRLSVDVANIDLLDVVEVTWSDGSLGCPAPGLTYTEAEVPGYQITLGAGGEEYSYHTDKVGGFVLCIDGRPAG